MIFPAANDAAHRNYSASTASADGVQTPNPAWNENGPTGRIAWVDHARGLCIIAVIAFYSSGYVENTLGTDGWMGYFVDFAQPFRMPDLFLISGMFVSHVIGLRWRPYLDRRVMYFLYFYGLWVTIRFAILRSPGMMSSQFAERAGEFFLLFVQPQGPLWFIYMLAIFFLAIRLTRNAPVWLMLLLAVLLKLAAPESDWKLLDRFSMYFVFFYCGHVFALPLLRAADWAGEHRTFAMGAILSWLLVNGWLVSLGVAHRSGVHLVSGLAGAGAVIFLAALLAQLPWMNWLRYLGQHSLVIYLGFVIPLALMRRLIPDLGRLADPGTLSLLTTLVSILGALALYRLVRNTPLRFLFERPKWARSTRLLALRKISRQV